MGHDSVIAYGVCLSRQHLDKKQCLIPKHLNVFRKLFCCLWSVWQPQTHGLDVKVGSTLWHLEGKGFPSSFRRSSRLYLCVGIRNCV